MKKMIYPRSFDTSHIAATWQQMALGLVASAALTPAPLQAADISAPRKLDAAAGIASGAEQLSDGQWKVRAEAAGAKDVDGNPTAHKNPEAKVSEINQAVLKVGVGLSDSLQFTLGLQGAKTVLKAKDNAFGDEASHDRGGFSGGSVDLRYRLTDGGSFFNSSLSAGAETGGQDKADQSLSRASTGVYRVGLGLSLGALDDSHVNLDLNYLSHGDDRFLTMRMGSEAMAALSAKWFFLDNLGLDTGLTMRQLQVRYTDMDGHEKNQGLSGGYYQAGLLVRGGGWEADVHAGQRLADRGFGFGKSFVGMGVAYTFGANGKRTDKDDHAAPAAKADSHKKSRQKVTTEEAKGPLGEKEPVSLEKLYDELSKQKGGDDPDEFESYEERAKKEKSLYGDGPDKSDVVEQQLEELRTIEKKTQEENARLDKQQEDADRRERLEYNKETAKKRRMMEESVRKEVDRMEGVTDEEVNWRGLE